MDLGLEGRVAIVTGGARGIGAGIVQGFAKEGANVVIADTSLDDARALAETTERDGIKVLAVRTDVTRKPDVHNLVSKALNEFGRIDILVNNAGIVQDKLFVDIRDEDWDRVNEVNVKGVYLVTKAIVPHMISARNGKIVNVSSLAGKEGSVGVTHYSASKFAVIGITQSLAHELAQYDINVNAVCPGILDTAMWEVLLEARSKRQGRPPEDIWRKMIGLTPLQRPQTAEDIANIILFLSSEVSRNITGEAISINGGLRMD